MIWFNSIPSIRALVPGGYEGMKLAVDLAVPEAYHGAVDVDAVGRSSPTAPSQPNRIARRRGVPSGIAIPAMGDRGDALVVALCCVTVLLTPPPGSRYDENVLRDNAPHRNARML